MTRRWRVLAVVSVAVFMASLDLFVVNVALPDIQRDFNGAGLSDLSWVLSGYSITFAALLVPAGRMADRFGRKAMFMAGLAVFTLSSAVCAAAPTLGVLVAARVAQAAGGAALFPTSLALLLPEFELPRRPTAIAMYSAVGGVAAAFGPPVGGILVEWSWRLIFLVNLPVGLVTLVVAARMLRESRDAEQKALPDVLGSLMLATGIAALVFGIVKGPEWGWDSTRVMGSFALAALLVAGFLARSRVHPLPVVELPMLRVGSFAMANIGAFAFFAAFAAFLLSGVLFLSEVWGYSVLRSGLAVAPGPAMAALTSIPGGKLGQKYGQGKVVVLSTTIFALGPAWWAWQLGLERDYAAAYLPGMLLTGIGVGPTIPNLSTAAVAQLPAARFATGSAIISMSRQIGSALGVALLIAVLGTPGPEEVMPAFQRGWLMSVFAALLSGASVLGFIVLRRPPARSPVPGRPGIAAG